MRFLTTVLLVGTTGFCLPKLQAQLPSKTIVNVKTSPFAVLKKSLLQKALTTVPAQVRTVSLVSAPAQVVDVSNVAKYPQANKRDFFPVNINPNCNVLPVNFTLSQQELGLLFPARNFKDAIFPGAVYRFSTIKEQSPTPYTRFTSRNPMDLTTDIFDARVTNNDPITISRFDIGTLSTQWKNLLTRYINGATPGDVSTEVILVESNAQMNATLSTGSTVDVGVKISAPIPNVPVTVDASNNVSVSNTSTVSSSSENKKNTVILKFKQVFYSARMSYKAGAQMDIFHGVDKSALEDDLVYVYSVDYGQMFYVVITSEFNKESLFNAVMSKVSTNTELGASPTGLPVKGSVSVGTTNQSSSETNTVFSSGKTTIKAFQYGGEPINLGTTIDEVLANLKTKINTRFNGTNLGAPIAYTLNFVKDHTPAWINTNISYATANCGIDLASRRYDVTLHLEKMQAPKVVDTDNNEDLFGSLHLNKFEVKGVEKMGFTRFWSKSGFNYDEFDVANQSGITKAYESTPTNIRVSKLLASNLTNADAKSSKIYVSGYLRDKEVLGDKEYVCQECNGAPRVISLANTSYASQIDALLPGQTIKLQMGNDRLFELNFFENGDQNSSHVKVYWSIEITAK